MAEQYLFWLHRAERVSGEVASIFLNKGMYGQVVNVPFRSASIHTFVLKWDITRVPDGMPLQYYPPIVNVPP